MFSWLKFSLLLHPVFGVATLHYGSGQPRSVLGETVDFCSYLLSLIFILCCSSNSLSTGHAFVPLCSAHIILCDSPYCIFWQWQKEFSLGSAFPWHKISPGLNARGGDGRGWREVWEEWLLLKPDNLPLLCPCWAPTLEDECLVFSNTHSSLGSLFADLEYIPPSGKTGFSRVKWIIYLAN